MCPRAYTPPKAPSCTETMPQPSGPTCIADPSVVFCPPFCRSKMAKWGAVYSAKDVRNRCSKRAQLLNESDWTFYARWVTTRTTQPKVILAALQVGGLGARLLP